MVNITVLYNAVILTYKLINQGTDMSNEQNTLNRINEAAKKEFLEKGFQGASLRNIVKDAGVTTGAFYGYYNSKEELFEALVEDKYQHIMNMYVSTQDEFKSFEPARQQNLMGKVSGDCLQDMLEYMYEYEDEFLMLLTASTGTKYENMIHEMCEVETKATYDFIKVMEADGRKINPIDPMLIHVLVSGMFGGFFELVIHRDKIKDAKGYLAQLRQFYTSGWSHLFGFEL